MVDYSDRAEVAKRWNDLVKIRDTVEVEMRLLGKRIQILDMEVVDQTLVDAEVETAKVVRI